MTPDILNILIGLAIGLLVSILLLVVVLGFIEQYKDWRWNRFVKRFRKSKNREIWDESGRDKWS